MSAFLIMKTRQLFAPAPPKSEIVKAKKYLNLFQNKKGTYLVKINDDELYISPEVFNHIITILADLYDGKLLFTTDVSQDITTGVAAKILGCSRVHVVKLINDGLINYTKIGKHRRINLREIIGWAENNNLKSGVMDYERNATVNNKKTKKRRKFLALHNGTSIA